MKLNFTVNGAPRSLETPPDQRLLDILRNELDLTGCKEGCGEGECGACTVLLDDKAVLACLTVAAQLEGAQITTIEGLTENGKPGALQAAFVEEGAVQCGYCIPGMVLSAKALLNETSDPTEDDIRRALAGNLCRCSGYTQIIRAVKRTAKEMGAE
ncbi:MAG: (2Fe-2S)-binding protein [Oscillospiraceae bacterium]|nr:(2Fe-2S)-binding protein [Oscillospiraceae bacterium]